MHGYLFIDKPDFLTALVGFGGGGGGWWWCWW